MTGKVLLTGGNGMVGSSLYQTLSPTYDILAPRSAELNLLSYNDVDSYLKAHEVSWILHAAGKVGGIQANINNPVDFLTENLTMGQNIVLAARNNNVPNLINFGSSCMYPKDSCEKLDEGMVLNGQLEPTNEGYAIAKCAIAKLCEYVTREDASKQYKTIIPSNLYGEKDSYSSAKSHLIPAIISKIHDAIEKNSSSVEIWGTGKVRREFLYVEDLSKFVSHALSNFKDMPTLINVGLGKDFTILEYYQMVAAELGYQGDFSFDISKPEGMKRKLLDISKAQKFGWSPQMSIQDGIKKTYQFYKDEVLSK